MSQTPSVIPDINKSRFPYYVPVLRLINDQSNDRDVVNGWNAVDNRLGRKIFSCFYAFTALEVIIGYFT